MEQKKIILLSILGNLVLLGASVWFFSLSNTSNRLLAQTEADLNSLQEKYGFLEEENRTLKNRRKLTGASEAPVAESAVVAKLKRALDEKDAEITRLKQVAERTGGNGRENRGRGNRERMTPQQRMEQLKQQDPERYERMMAEREKRQKEMEARNEKRDQYIAGLDQEKLTDAQRQTVDDYQNLLKAQETLRNNMQNGQGGRESFMSMMQNQRALQTLSAQVQDILIEQYANSLSNGNGTAVAEEIRNIINATSTDMRGPGPEGPGPGGPGPQ